MCYTLQSREPGFSFPRWHCCSTFSRTSASNHFLARCVQPPHSWSHRPRNEFMKHRETMMNINALHSRPMSACLRLFVQSLLAEHYTEIAIEECLADDANRSPNNQASTSASSIRLPNGSAK